MFNQKKNLYFGLIIIFLGFFYSCFVGHKYIKQFDVLMNINSKTINTYFFEKEGGTPSYWNEAAIIKEEINDKNFFLTGNRYEFKYLPPRLVYLYYKLIGKEIKTQINNSDDEVFQVDNGKFGLILIQNFFYLISLIYLLFSVKKYYSNNNILALMVSLIFLSFEPTLNQWNRVLYSETIFFCLQILIISILITYNEDSTYKKTIFIGIILSLMYLQRTVSMYYFLIIFLYFFIFFRKFFFINTAIITIIYLTIHLILGYQNLNRDGKMYFVPILAKEDLYGYFIPKIIKYNKDKNYMVNFQTRHDKLNNFIETNNLDSEDGIDIVSRLNIANNNFIESINLISEYPIESLKEYTVSLFHYYLLKPNEINFLLKNETKYNGKFYSSKEFKKELSFKVIYSLLVYSISIMGFLFFVGKKNYKIIFLLLSSILYFSLPVVWHKQSSYLAPTLIYISIFFGAGFSQLINYIINLKYD